MAIWKLAKRGHLHDLLRRSRQRTPVRRAQVFRLADVASRHLQTRMAVISHENPKSQYWDK